MCGIAGLWLNEPRADGAELAARMGSCMRHRGPDSAGTWSDGTIHLAHRRLAVLDLSCAAEQPMGAGSCRPILVYNGEIYNFMDLRAELQAGGVSFTSTSDTEVILRGYERWGEDVLDRLVGMFAFGIWDPRRRVLLLARDRAGEKPLYYAHGAWGFAFASDITALARLEWTDTRIDQRAVSQFLTYQYVAAPDSIYHGIKKLPPAHALRVGDTGQDQWRYWNPARFATGERLQISFPEAVEEVDHLLGRAVRGQLASDVPLGAFLSGGYDSTAVVQKMVEQAPGRVRTFTIGFPVDEYDESEHAAAVAAHLGTDHTVEELSEADVLELVPALPTIFGEPFADSSALPTHLVSVIARKNVTVSLSGDGGDELFGGYRRYLELERIGGAARTLRSLRPALAMAGRHLPGRAGRIGSVLAQGPSEIYRRFVTVFSPMEAEELTGTRPRLEPFDRAWTEQLSTRGRAMLSDFVTYLPEDILVKVDRAAMATSLETRAPFLDHRLIEFALQLPDPLRQRKRLIKALVHRTVPETIMDRPKKGFGVPLERWFRGELKPLLLDTVTPDRLLAIGIDGGTRVSRMISEHLSGQRSHTHRLWALLVLALWYEHETSLAARSPI